MATNTRATAIRISLEGKDEVKGGLKEVGDSGQAAYQSIGKAAEDAGRVTDQQMQRYKALAQIARETQSEAQNQSNFNAFMGISADPHGADAAAAAQVFQQQIEKVDELHSGIGTLISDFTMLRGAMATLGIALGIGELISFGRQVFENAAQLNNQARATGFSVTALQAYRAALQQGGVATEDADALLRRFTLSIGRAKDTTGDARQAFADLFQHGLQFADLAAPDSALAKVAKAILDIRDAEERARIEAVLFGRSGQEVESSLVRLAQGSDLLAQKLDAQGRLLGPDQAKAAEDASTRIAASFQHLEVVATPVITGITDYLSDMIERLEKAASHPWDVKLIFNLLKLPVDTVAGWFGGGSPPPPPAPTGDVGKLLNSVPATFQQTAFNTPNLDKYIAQLTLGAQLAHETNVERAVEQALIDAATAKLTDQGKAQGKIVTSVADATKELGPALAAKISATAADKAMAEAAQKTSDKVDHQAERIAKETAFLDADAKAALGVAAAYLISGDAALQAEAKRKALTDAIKKGGDLELRTREQLGIAIADAAEAGAKSVDDLNAQTEAQKRANDAIASGRLTAAQANQQMQTDLALRPLITAWTKAEGDAADVLMRVILRVQAARAADNAEKVRSAALSALNSQQHEIDTLNLQLSLYGQSKNYIALQVALLKERNDLLDKGIDPESELGQKLLANTAQIEQAKQQLQLMQASTQELEGEFDNLNGIWNDFLKAGDFGWKSWAKLGLDAIQSIADEFGKLSANELKNQLFGENLPTLSSVGGILGQIFGGTGLASLGKPDGTTGQPFHVWIDGSFGGLLGGSSDGGGGIFGFLGNILGLGSSSSGLTTTGDLSDLITTIPTFLGGAVNSGRATISGSSNDNGGRTALHITVEVSGANGDKQIEAAVHRGVSTAISASKAMLQDYDDKLEVKVLPFVRRANDDRLLMAS